MNITGLFKKLTPEEKIVKSYIREVFGVTPKSIEHYKIALTHSSMLPRSSEFIQSNERLEFLGDAVLDSVIAYSLYKNNPNLSEGELTKLKSKLVSRKNLNSLAYEIGLESHLNYSINSDTQNTSILGNALEALVGAIFLDLGYRLAEKATFNLLNQVDTNKVLYEQKDYKSLLHEWGQQMKKEVLFRTVNELKIAGRSEYEVEVLISGRKLGKAKASSKKKAQQLAAKSACLDLNL